MEIAQLEAFVRVATEGSVTRAAAALQRTQPTISTRIAALERSVSASLFERVGNGMVLTPAGKALLPIAQRILELRVVAQREVEVARQTHVAVVRIGANNWSSDTVIPELVSKLRSIHPETALEIRVQSTYELELLLNENRIDVAFLNPSLTRHGLKEYATYSQPCVLVSVNPQPEPITAADAATRKFLSYTAGPALEATQKLSMVTGTRLEIVASSNSAQLVRTLVLGGLGVAFLPLSSVEEHLQDARLHHLAISDLTVQPWSVSLVSLPKKRLQRESLDFIDIAVGTFEDLGSVAG